MRADLKNLGNNALHDATVRQAKFEQTATLDLLYHLVEVRHRRLYGFLGYSSLWDYVRSLGYSESGTGERVRAMELLIGNETVVAEKLKSNALSLTTASQIQIHVRKMNQNAHRMTPAAALELIEAASGKSKREVETMLLERTPVELRPVVVPEKFRQLTSDLQEVKIVIDTEMQDLIRRYKELKGERPLLEIFKEVLREAIRRKDPLQRENAGPTSAGNGKQIKSGIEKGIVNVERAATRYISQATRRFVFQRAAGQCEHVSEVGKRCGSRYRLEIDHIKPFGVSQDHSVDNLRALCPTHNKTHAIEFYGWNKMGPYLEQGQT